MSVHVDVMDGCRRSERTVVLNSGTAFDSTEVKSAVVAESNDSVMTIMDTLGSAALTAIELSARIRESDQ